MTITAAAARRILRGQGMPREEIRAVLATDDPLFVRRLLELHRERLEEWLEEQRRLIESIEPSLVAEPRIHPGRPGEEPCASRSVVSRRRALRGADDSVRR